MPDIVPHLGRYCEVATRSGRFFGELIRVSSALFLVRAPWPASGGCTVDAAEIARIIDLTRPHL